MSSLGSLNIQLSLDTAQFQQSLAKSDLQTKRFAKHFTVDMDKAKHSAKQFADRTTEYLRSIEYAAKNINTAAKWEFRFNNLDRAKYAATEFFRLADSHTELSNKLKLVTDTEKQHTQAMAAVYDISMKTAQSSQAVATVYQSFARNAKELGVNQQQIASISETVAKAMAISGASAAAAQATLGQFGQALGSGVLRGQEFNSVMEQAPGLAQAIARDTVKSCFVNVRARRATRTKSGCTPFRLSSLRLLNFILYPYGSGHTASPLLSHWLKI